MAIKIRILKLTLQAVSNVHIYERLYILNGDKFIEADAGTLTQYIQLRCMKEKY